MSKTNNLPDLIPYDEAYRILKEKFNSTRDEFRYWVKKDINKIYNQEYDDDETITTSRTSRLSCDNGLIFPFISDLPFFGRYGVPSESFFYPECYFYQKRSILNFVPSPPLRFVYQKDLTGKRNWNDSTRSLNLLKANEYGILTFYHKDNDDFFFSPNGNQLWCHTFEGEEYVENPESFFLLYDILNVERIFFEKDRDICLNELDIKSDDIPTNVIHLKTNKDKQ